MTEEEFITAVTVTGGNSDDGKQLSSLLKQTLETGIPVQEVIGDTAYSSKENLLQMKTNAIQAVVPLHPIVHHGNLKQKGFTYHKDAHIVICPAGQRSIRQKRNHSKTRKNRSDSFSFYFDIKTCRNCPLQESCLKPGAQSKMVSIRIIADHLREQMHFERSHMFKERIRRRPIIEHKNAELKRFHGLYRAKYRGLFRMHIQAILTAFTVNSKRMVQLIKQMQPVS